jgi:hypothetical protein
MSTRDHVFTLGIEKEFQFIDPERREPRSHIQEILASAARLPARHFHVKLSTFENV